MNRPFDELLLPTEAHDGVKPLSVDSAKWLAGANTRQVLRQLTLGDPLGLEARCALRLRDQALLIARERLVMRVLAQVAFQARAYRTWQPMDIWLRLQIDRSIESLLDRDRDDERHGAACAPEDALRFLSEALGIEPRSARRSAIAFNDLPIVVRRAFWDVVVEGVTEARLAASGLARLEQVRARVDRALRTLAIGSDPGGTDKHDMETQRG